LKEEKDSVRKSSLPVLHLSELAKIRRQDKGGKATGLKKKGRCLKMGKKGDEVTVAEMGRRTFRLRDV